MGNRGITITAQKLGLAGDLFCSPFLFETDLMKTEDGAHEDEEGDELDPHRPGFDEVRMAEDYRNGDAPYSRGAR